MFEFIYRFSLVTVVERVAWISAFEVRGFPWILANSRRPGKRGSALLASCFAGLLFLSLLFFTVAASPADTITQTNAQGQVEVIQTDAIVIHQDSSTIVYKHFDLRQRRVVKVQLNEGSLPYQVTESGPAGRQQIVHLWKAFGYTATVTSTSGKTTQVYDAYVDFFPPPGVGTFLESVPPRTNFPLLLDQGGADEIEFSDISTIQNHGGHLTVTLTNGRVESGKFLMPTREPAIVHFCGITDHYSPASPDTYDFSLPLAQVKEVKFVQQ